MLDAGVLGYLGKPLALFLFSLHARFPRVLHGERAPDSLHGLGEGGGIIQIAPDDLGAELSQSLGIFRIGVAGHGSNGVAPRQKLPGDGPALFALLPRSQEPSCCPPSPCSFV